MVETPWQAFSDRIAWEGPVHITCEPLATPLEAQELAHLRELDAGVLGVLDMLGERAASEPSEDDPNAAVLARIDSKLDVLLEMFNRHLLGHLQMPPRRTVRFNARGIVIDDLAVPGPGTAVLVRLHFDLCVGLPLELPGRVAPPQSAGVFIAFDELPADIRQGIEHLVFRQHRRQLAESRRDGRLPAP